MSKTVRLLSSGAAVLWALAFGAAGAEWPSKPVRIIVPIAAGGAADMIGRVFAAHLSTSLGQQFFVENRGGGGGLTGTEFVARSEPDGYTLMVSGMPFHVLAPAMNRNASFDPVRDFTHIAYFGGTPIVVVVHPSLGAKTFAEFSALADGKNGAVDYVSPGIGSVGNVVAEVLAAKANLKLQHVPYKGGGAAIFDLIAGHVKVGCMTWSTTLEHMRSGALVPIGVTTPQRLPEFPDLPTFDELGYKDLVLTSWFSLSGPAKLSKHVVDQLNREINDGTMRDEVRRKLEKEAVLTKSMTPEEFTRFVESEVDKWSPVVKTLIPVK